MYKTHFLIVFLFVKNWKTHRYLAFVPTNVPSVAKASELSAQQTTIPTILTSYSTYIGGETRP